MPWANGLGNTTELYVHNSRVTGRMLWRISMAGVDADGPFSHFEGYERVLVLLRGEGLTLNHANGTEHRLSRPFELATFPGDIETQATLIDGPILDFNVITDRASFAARVSVTAAIGDDRISIDCDTLAIYAVDNILGIVDSNTANHLVPQGSLALIGAPKPGAWELSGATAIVIQLQSIR